jgi:hypothetical protein
MKLTDILLLGLSLVLIIIGIDQTVAFGFKNSYWAFMLALTLFFVFTLRKNRDASEEQAGKPDKTSKKPGSRK